MRSLSVRDFYKIVAKLKIREIREKLGNFAKLYRKLKLFALKKSFIYMYITPTQFWNTTYKLDN